MLANVGLFQAFKRKYSAHAAASLVYSPAFCCDPWMKEIKQAATVLGRLLQTVDRRNSDYVTGRQDYFTVLDIYA